MAKNTKSKAKFIESRAKGCSYSSISEQLHISKNTCSEWERELASSIQEQIEERLEELSALYGMHKEARITRLGETLSRIDSAIAQHDLAELPLDKLLQLKLQYERELRTEYREPQPTIKDATEGEMLEAVTNLYTRQQRGDITPQDAKTQLATLEAISKAKTKKDNSEMFLRCY